MEPDIERCTRHCSTSGRELEPGEEIFSALAPERGKLRRHDYSAVAWAGPPEGAVAWWKSRIPLREQKRPNLTPNDALLDVFRNLEHEAPQQELRYVLALLLVRRRVLRQEELRLDTDGSETLVLHSPREDVNYAVRVALPDESHAAELQARLTALVYATESS